VDVVIEKVKNIIFNLTPYQIADIALISVLIFLTVRFLVNRNSIKLVQIFVLILLLSAGIALFDLQVSGYLTRIFLALFYVPVFILYAPEIRRGIWNVERKFNFEHTHAVENTPAELKDASEQIVKAVQNMAKRDIGALIVFVEDNLPAGIPESGVAINAVVSSQLIESIFIPKTPLHDGAMLIRGNRILAAGCFLPLSQEVNLPKEFGTRHRAAIGITEMHDVTAVVVSEETGIISTASRGQLKRYLDGDMLKEAIDAFYKLGGDANADKKKKRTH
jgi:diadenylate cyclase